MKNILFLLMLLIVATSCEKQEDKDREIILKYIADNNLNATEGPEGLFYVIERVGTGNNPNINSYVTVDYEGFLVNGQKFDSSLDRGQPSSFTLGAVIRGWQLGVPFIKSGGKGKLIIPSTLGYGPDGAGNGAIPPNSVLIFNIDLISFR